MDIKKDLLFLISAGSGFLLLAALAYLLHFHPGAFRPSASIRQTNAIGSTQILEIDFSFPVVTQTIEKNLTILPEAEFSINWSNHNQTLKIIPKSLWAPQTNYLLSIANGKNIFQLGFSQDFSFSTKPFPKIKSLVPLEGEKNVAVDIEEPVAVSFDRPLDEYSVKFEVSPTVQLEYQMNEEKTNIKLLAKNNFDWKTHYQIGVFVKQNMQKDDGYVKVGQTSFETTAPPSTDWSSDLTTLLAQAKDQTKSVINTGKYIDVNLKYQVMVIFENGKALDAYRISSGKKGLETPEGQFKIENKSPRAWSPKYGLFMPNWMAILPSGEVGIHELPVWPGGFQEGASHLGIPVSHGCIRLGTESARRVYGWAEIGTPVVVHK